jgi:cytoskeletal protein RodZ
LSLFPLSTGENEERALTRDGIAALRPAVITLDQDGPLGPALRRARESLGLDVDDIALATKVRASYIAALENMDLGALPAGPFANGYVKAYARALGVDPDMAAARFKGEAPEPDTDLRSPMGIRFRRGTRLRGLAAAAIVVVAGFTAWNLLVRIRTVPARTPAAAPAIIVRTRSAPGPAILGAPLPAPPEATTPPPYETPGLAEATAKTGPDAAAAVTARIAAEAAAARPADPVAAGAAFASHGPIYGAAKGQLLLQALRPMSLVVRNGGAILFARQLAAGEAWRAPATDGLSADVDASRSIEAYVDGKAVGVLAPGLTPLSTIKAPQPANTASSAK